MIQLYPICLPCWRTFFSMTADPPVTPRGNDWKLTDHHPEEECVICLRLTDHGIYLPRGAIKHLLSPAHRCFRKPTTRQEVANAKRSD